MKKCLIFSFKMPKHFWGGDCHAGKARQTGRSSRAAALDRAALVGAGAGDSELVAEGLRVAARALGRVTGRVDVEDLLDVIFNEFCIGK